MFANRDDVEGRLLNLYSDSDQIEKLNNFEKEINQNIKAKNTSRTQVIVKDEKYYDFISNKIGRNEQCPCGSGKKYKKCCGK